ncbi:phosphotransferase enzyme family-domain-containing protein, partial [Cubamyces menziesii]
ITWPTLPAMPLYSHINIFPNVGRKFYNPSPSTILKLRASKPEGIMTALAHIVLGPFAPKVVNLITISDLPRQSPALLMTLQPGKTLTELWPELTATQRSVVKANLCTLIVRMRASQFHYHGIPGRLPYRIIDELKGTVNYAFCTTREEWDNSRVAAIWANARDAQIDEARCVTLERVQRETLCDDRAVLTHCDLSDRNILVDPTTLEVTGLIDWEMANVMPAYFEYAMARLSGGHDPWWRRELLEVLKEVLR